MTNIEYEGRTLEVNDTEQKLPGDIDAVRLIRGKIIVLFTPSSSENESRNVWAFEPDGSQHWKIESTTGPSEDENPYVQISERNGILWVADWKGTEYEIDIETGDHIDRKLRK